MALDESELHQIVNDCGYGPLVGDLAAMILRQTNELTADRNEAAMFLAQLILESGGFLYREEIGGAKQRNAPYHGRGYIQLTWEPNYRAASLDLFGDERLVRDPDAVSRNPDLSMQVSVWFWKKHVRPGGGPAQNKFGLTTKAINGGLPGGSNNKSSRKRYDFYKKAAAVLGVRTLASEEW